MPEIIEVEFHSKYLSDFQLSRLVEASLRKYTVAITAFISDAVIIDDRCLGGGFRSPAARRRVSNSQWRNYSHRKNSKGMERRAFLAS